VARAVPVHAFERVDDIYSFQIRLHAAIVCPTDLPFHPGPR
jgi:hypothetical protein